MSKSSESGGLPVESALSSEATSSADYESMLAQHQQRLAALGEDGQDMDRARTQLDILVFSLMLFLFIRGV